MMKRLIAALLTSGPDLGSEAGGLGIIIAGSTEHRGAYAPIALIRHDAVPGDQWRPKPPVPDS